MNYVQVKGESSLNLTERILMSAELVFASSPFRWRSSLLYLGRFMSAGTLSSSMCCCSDRPCVRHHRYLTHEQHRQPISGLPASASMPSRASWAIVPMLGACAWATFTYKRGQPAGTSPLPHLQHRGMAGVARALYHWHARGHPRHPPAGRVRHRHQRHRGDLGCHFVRKRTQE